MHTLNAPSDLDHDSESLTREEFSRLMRTNLQFRFAMITKRSLELGEVPPSQLYATSIYDPDLYRQAYEQQHLDDHTEALCHEQLCRDLGYDPSATSPEQLAGYIETVALDHQLCDITNDYRNCLLHPVDEKKREREEELREEVREIDGEY